MMYGKMKDDIPVSREELDKAYDDLAVCLDALETALPFVEADGSKEEIDRVKKAIKLIKGENYEEPAKD